MRRAPDTLTLDLFEVPAPRSPIPGALDIGLGVRHLISDLLKTTDANRYTIAARMMLSINDHPDIRACFTGMTMHEVGIRYSVANAQGQPKESGELVITNYDLVGVGGLF